MPKLRKNGGSEHQTKKRWWFWMPSCKEMLALNTKPKKDGDSERQNWEEMVALNAKTKKRLWLWTPNYKEMVALNAKPKRNGGPER